MLRLQGKSQKLLTESLVSYKIKKKKIRLFLCNTGSKEKTRQAQKITYKAVKNGENKTNFRTHKNVEYIALGKHQPKKQDSEAENAGQLKRNGGNIHVGR